MRRRSPLSCLIFFIGEIGHNVADAAIQYAAEHFDGMGADAFVALHPRQLAGADAVFFDKGILGDAASFHGFPKVVVGDHNMQAPLSTCMLTENDIYQY